MVLVPDCQLFARQLGRLQLHASPDQSNVSANSDLRGCSKIRVSAGGAKQTEAAGACLGRLWTVLGCFFVVPSGEMEGKA